MKPIPLLSYPIKNSSMTNSIVPVSYTHLISLEAYKKYAVKRGDTRAIHATLKESKPMLEIDQRELDVDAVSYTHLDVYKRQDQVIRKESL